jgi:hypothetical protein
MYLSKTGTVLAFDFKAVVSTCIYLNIQENSGNSPNEIMKKYSL